MSEENTNTDISSLRDEYELPPRQHPLPWILFGISAVMLALVGGLLARKVNLETRRANEEVEKNAGLKAQLDQLQKMQADADQRIADAQAKASEAREGNVDSAAKVKKAEADRDKAVKEAEAKVKKLEAERDKLQKQLDAAKKDSKTGKKKKKR